MNRSTDVAKIARPNIQITVRSPGTTTRRARVQHGLSPDGAMLFAGTEIVWLANVARYTASGLSVKDLPTAFATIAIFSAVAAACTVGVVEVGWRTRMMFEGALFGAIALCAVAELFSARRQALYTFKIVTKDGAEVTFVTTDAAQAEAVKLALEKHGVANTV